VETVANFRQIALAEVLRRHVGITAKGCWLWIGPVSEKGYGFIEITIGHQKRRYTVFRLLYDHFKGKAPWGSVRRHECNVRRCINPEHIIPGTAKENTADMIRAGRAGWQNGAPEEEPEIIEYRLPEVKLKKVFGRY